MTASTPDILLLGTQQHILTSTNPDILENESTSDQSDHHNHEPSDQSDHHNHLPSDQSEQHNHVHTESYSDQFNLEYRESTRDQEDLNIHVQVVGGSNLDQVTYNIPVSSGSHQKPNQAEYNNPEIREPTLHSNNDYNNDYITDDNRSDINNYLPSYEETYVSNQPGYGNSNDSISIGVPKNFESENQNLSTLESTLEVVANDEEELCLYKSSVQYSEINIIPQEPEKIIIEPQDQDIVFANANGQSLTAEPVLNIRGDVLILDGLSSVSPRVSMLDISSSSPRAFQQVTKMQEDFLKLSAPSSAVCTPRHGQVDTYTIGSINNDKDFNYSPTSDNILNYTKNDIQNRLEHGTVNKNIKKDLREMVSEEPSEAWYDVPQEIVRTVQSLQRQQTSLDDYDIERVVQDLNETIKKESKYLERYESVDTEDFKSFDNTSISAVIDNSTFITDEIKFETSPQEVKINEELQKAELQLKKRSKLIDEFEISTEITKQEINKTKNILLVSKDGSIDIEEFSITGNIDEAKDADDMHEDHTEERFKFTLDRSQHAYATDYTESNANWNDKMQNFRFEKQVSWVDEYELEGEKLETQITEEDLKKNLEESIVDELDKHIRDEKKRLDTDLKEKNEKGSKTIKKLKLIRQKTVDFVQGKEAGKMKSGFGGKKGDNNAKGILEALALGAEEELMKSPLKRKKRIEYMAEKLLNHNIGFLGNIRKKKERSSEDGGEQPPGSGSGSVPGPESGGYGGIKGVNYEYDSGELKSKSDETASIYASFSPVKIKQEPPTVQEEDESKMDPEEIENTDKVVDLKDNSESTKHESKKKMSFLRRFSKADQSNGGGDDSAGNIQGNKSPSVGAARENSSGEHDSSSSTGGRQRRVSSDSKGTGERKKSVFSKINEDWNNFLRDIGTASTMNPKENIM